MKKKYIAILSVIIIATICAIASTVSWKSLTYAKLVNERTVNELAQAVTSATFLNWELSDAYTANSFNTLSQIQRQAAIINYITTNYNTNISQRIAKVLVTAGAPNFGDKLEVNTALPALPSYSILILASIIPNALLVCILVIIAASQFCNARNY